MGLAWRARCVRKRLAAGAVLALLMGLPLGSAAAQPAPAHDDARCARPALWVVNDADTTIYLFGTIHTHDGRTHWFDHAVRRAFDASAELVLETIVPPQPAPVQAPAGSGLAAARETMRTARTLGMSAQLGADLVLHRAAEASGKPVIGLETFAEQIEMYRSLPSPARPAAPAAAMVQPASDPAVAPFLRTMVDSWNRGDSRPIEAVVGAVRTQSPDAYRRLFSDRNGHWARWIEHRLESPGTVFVAVGTGHLVGADSIQQRLAASGIRSARIN